MPATEKHPHQNMASDDQLAELVAAKSPTVQQLYLATHRLVVDTLPDVRHSVDMTDAMIGYGARQYGYDGWGMAALGAYAKWVSLAFFRGATLDDPDGMLEGSGAAVRHVKLRSAGELELRGPALQRMLRAAASAE